MRGELGLGRKLKPVSTGLVVGNGPGALLHPRREGPARGAASGCIVAPRIRGCTVQSTWWRVRCPRRYAMPSLSTWLDDSVNVTRRGAGVVNSMWFTRWAVAVVGAVDNGMRGGSFVLGEIETRMLVVQPSSVMRTRQRRFVGSRHPRRMTVPSNETSHPVRWKDTSHPASTKVVT